MGVYEQPGRMAPPQGNDKKALKLKNRQEKILKQFGPLLKHVLEFDEKVLLATRACSPITIGQQLTTGWIIFVLKRCVLVFTNKRILHIPTKSNYTPRGSVAEIAYTDLTEAKVGTFFGRTFNVRYRSGKKEKFLQMPAMEHRYLKELLPTLPVGRGPSSPAAERRSLCPRCKTGLAKKQFVCASCGLEFKNRRRAAFLSILVPGGGYFYTRHPLMGVLDAIAETYLTVMVLAFMVASFTSSGEDAAAALFLSAFILGLLAVEKLVTVSHAFHFVDEYIPIERDPNRLHATGTMPAFVPAR